MGYHQKNIKPLHIAFLIAGIALIAFGGILLSTRGASTHETTEEQTVLDWKLVEANYTYDQVVAFLGEDRTDEKPYIDPTYVCIDFAVDVWNSAEEEGLRCGLVLLEFLDEGHSIVAFDTIDRGVVYFDPMTDERVNPEIGKHYYQCIVPEPGYYYASPSYDDTILNISIIWQGD